MLSVRKLTAIIAVVVIVGGIAISGMLDPQISAQDATPTSLEGHPLIGTWMVDTDIATDTDLPEVGIFTSDGSVFGLGATRWVSGAWEATDGSTGSVTMAGVFAADGGGYAVLRGLHVVDETGNAWSCDCTFTIVAPDGSVVVSGMATAHATRLPIESADAVGSPLAGFPTWSPATEATPAA